MCRSLRLRAQEYAQGRTPPLFHLHRGQEGRQYEAKVVRQESSGRLQRAKPVGTVGSGFDSVAILKATPPGPCAKTLECDPCIWHRYAFLVSNDTGDRRRRGYSESDRASLRTDHIVTNGIIGCPPEPINLKVVVPGRGQAYCHFGNLVERKFAVRIGHNLQMKVILLTSPRCAGPSTKAIHAHLRSRDGRTANVVNQLARHVIKRGIWRNR